MRNGHGQIPRGAILAGRRNLPAETWLTEAHFDTCRRNWRDGLLVGLALGVALTTAARGAEVSCAAHPQGCQVGDTVTGGGICPTLSGTEYPLCPKGWIESAPDPYWQTGEGHRIEALEASPVTCTIKHGTGYSSYIDCTRAVASGNAHSPDTTSAAPVDVTAARQILKREWSTLQAASEGASADAAKYREQMRSIEAALRYLEATP